MSQINVEDIYPLSPLQEGMLFHTLYAPQSGVYFRQVSWLLKDLNVAAFEQVWEKLAERHAVLRTAFVWGPEGKPLQAVRRQVKLPWQQHDWREFDTDEQQAQIASFLQADRERGF